MGFVVVHKGETSEREFRHYLLLAGRRLLARGIGLDRVPRAPENGPEGRWLYVSSDEAEARDLADEIRKTTEDEGWEVKPVEGAPSEGPLSPLTVVLCWELTGFAFALDPLTEWALEMRFPDSLRYEQVFVNADLVNRTPTTEEIRELAADVLPILVRLQPDLCRAFGGYEVVQPVKQEVLVPRVPFQS